MPSIYNFPTYAPLAYDEFHRAVFGSAGTIECVPFYQEYFSGADVNIYFQNIFIDEAVSLQFVLHQEIRPIYGYSSYVYDALVVGRRIVQGSFTINYREPYYIERKVAEALGFKKPPEDKTYGATRNMFTQLASGLASCGFALTTEEKSALSQGKIPERLAMHIVARDDPRVNSVVDGLKERQWSLSEDRLAKQRREPFFKFSEPLNIYIAFGQMPHRNFYSATWAPQTPHDASWLKESETISRALHLINRLGPRLMLSEVQIVSVQQVSDAGAEQPVMEEYGFIARDLVKQPQIVERQP
ncbi:MAG: hypothetical protein AB1330_01265 [Bacillota bacterium]